MTDHKYTDEEVIRALECCFESELCDKCPYEELVDCTWQRDRNAIALVNRQKAEIERLQEECDQAWEEHSDIQIKYDLLFDEARALIKKAKSEAIKEFAERLKERFFNYYEGLNENTSKSNYHGETLMFYEVADMIEDCIENLVEEMTEGKPCTDGADCSTCEHCYHDGGYNECATDGVKL